MNCLHCGDCCLRMFPLNGGRCPHVVEDRSFVFCGIYDRRPEECRKHGYDARFCPVGMNVLGFDNPQAVALRIDEGWEKIKKMNNKGVQNGLEN